MKFNKTMFAVVVFITLMSIAAYSVADDGVKVSLGKTILNSDATFGEIGYEYNNFEVNVGYLGHGDTKKAYQENPIPFYSVSHLIRPDWNIMYGQNYYRIGVVHVEDSPLVGDTNYRLGIGLDYGVLSVEYFHFSSAGIYETNTGLDGIQLKMNISLR